MADNFIADPGAGGVTFASDEIATVHHPRTKVEFGADGSATDVADVEGSRLPVKVAMAATATRTSVADSATAVTILASNGNRKGAVITNDSSAVLYLGLGAVNPTTSDYTAKIFTGQTYEPPACFTGDIKGIWDTDPNDGGARVTELT